MSQTDSPKHRGDVLTSAWRNSNPQIGIPQADWSHCDIRNKECPRFRAIYRNLEYLAAPGCDLTESLFAHCNLNHTDFQRALAPGASWHSSFLEQARLNAIRAPKADFRQAHLRSASFQRSILNHSLFSFANIQHANFQQADLRYSDLRAANLQFAKIDGATLTGAIINPQTQDSSNWTKKNNSAMAGCWSRMDRKTGNSDSFFIGNRFKRAPSNQFKRRRCPHHSLPTEYNRYCWGSSKFIYLNTRH